MDKDEVCPICGRRSSGGWLCRWCGTDLKKLPEPAEEPIDVQWRALGERALSAVMPASLALAALLSVAVVLTSGTRKVKGAQPVTQTEAPTATPLLGIPRVTRTPTPEPTASSTPSPTPSPTPYPSPTPTPTPDTTWLDRSFDVSTSDVEFVARIVGGEANCMEKDAQVMVACQIWGDVAEGIPVASLPSRWYGYKDPNESAYDATVQGLLGTPCEALPRCRYVINDNDLKRFLRDGIIEPEALGEAGGRFWIGIDGDMLYCIPR